MLPAPVLLSALLLALAPSQAGDGGRPLDGELWLRDVRVVSLEEGRVLAGRTVVVAGGRITAVGGAELVPPADAAIVEGGGRHLLPGLVDAHVHLDADDPDDLLLLFLAAGVTTVQCMSGDPHTLALREEVAAGRVVGPRILTTGPTTARLGVHFPAEAERLVEEQRAAGYDAIKMYGDGRDAMPRETYHRLIVRAHEAGLRVVGHAPRNHPFAVVLEEGQDSIDHMEEIVYTDAGLGRLLAPYVEMQFGRRPFPDDPGPVPDLAGELEVEIADLAARVRAAGLAVTPTLVTFAAIQRSTGDELAALAAAPELVYAHPLRRAEWTPERLRFRNGLWAQSLPFVSEYLARNLELQMALVKAFHDAGVPLLAGTDAPFDFVVQGFGLHRELELLVASGLTPLDALRAATLVPAHELGLADEAGGIAPGMRADLVLVEGDPLADIGHIRRIAGVCAGGRWLDRATLDRGLARIAELYR